LEGVSGVTALHICFGYALVHGNSVKPKAYDFLTELNRSRVDVISIEAAQPGLDPSILTELPDKIIMYGVIDLADPAVETPEIVAASESARPCGSCRATGSGSRPTAA